MASRGSSDTVTVRRDGRVTVITINRPSARNAVDLPTAEALAAAFTAFDRDDEAAVAVLTGADGHFCAGADLKALADNGDTSRRNRIAVGGNAPMGPTRMILSKPVIAAVEGYAVAGGLELACWADLRVASESAVFGVFCRRFGVPLIDGGTVRLPRLIGESRAMDMILTGRAVSAEEALAFGLANRVVPKGTALTEAVALARQLAELPQACMRNDRLSVLESAGRMEKVAMANEFRRGRISLQDHGVVAGTTAFAKGAGRGGRAALVDVSSAPSTTSSGLAQRTSVTSNEAAMAYRGNVTRLTGAQLRQRAQERAQERRAPTRRMVRRPAPAAGQQGARRIRSRL